MNADSSHIEFTLERPPVKRLDILQLMPKGIRPRIDLLIRQGMKHECIVGIRAMADSDDAFGHRFSHNLRAGLTPQCANVGGTLGGALGALAGAAWRTGVGSLAMWAYIV
jgi:hypothetical protein